MFHYTIKLLSNGINPIFVFDGRPPKENLVENKEAPNKPNQVCALPQHPQAIAAYPHLFTSVQSAKLGRDACIEDCKKLLRLMGVPVIDARRESESQCAAFVKAGKVVVLTIFVAAHRSRHMPLRLRIWTALLLVLQFYCGGSLYLKLPSEKFA